MEIQGSEITHTEMMQFLFCIVNIYIFVLKLSDMLKIKHLLITRVEEDRSYLNNSIFQISTVTGPRDTPPVSPCRPGLELHSALVHAYNSEHPCSIQKVCLSDGQAVCL